jgi:hypothetical protein
MIDALIGEGVRFLLVGGYAVGMHGHQRMTSDIDFWVMPTSENSIRLIRALEKFGAPTHDITAEYFEKEGNFFQIGIAPIRIDILTEIAGVNFDEAYKNVVTIERGGLKIPVISISDLIKNKRASGRALDLNDAEHLEAIVNRV